MNGNILALLSLLAYPFVVVALFVSYRPPVAIALSLILSEIFLPPGYCLPISPHVIDKTVWSPFLAWIGALIFARPSLRNSRPFRGVEGIFLLGLVGSIFTWWTNRDPLYYGNVVLEPQSFRDVIIDAIRIIADPWVGFYLGRTIFRTSRDLFTLVRVMVVSTAAYTVFILFEIRMSPNLNRIIYGFQATGFGMTIRFGGYRPMTFFVDGLHLASYLLVCTVMAVALARYGKSIGLIPPKILSFYLVAILVLCKSTGAILYAALLVPLAYFASHRKLLLVARIFVIIFLIYPILRFNDLIPTKPIVSFFEGYSTDRAGSLAFRFEMEQGMIDRTWERPWWGWGSYARNFAYNVNTGERLSVPDGAVIISTSARGYLGFFAYYFPFAYAVLRSTWLIKKVKSNADRLLLSTLALVCATILIDLIMNSAFFPLFMLLFGAVYGLPLNIAKEEAAKAAAQAEADRVASSDQLAPGYL